MSDPDRREVEEAFVIAKQLALKEWIRRRSIRCCRHILPCWFLSLFQNFSFGTRTQGGETPAGSRGNGFM